MRRIDGVLRCSLGSCIKALLATLVMIFPCAAQQAQLSIDSPTTGTVVNPGQSLLISVSPPTNTSFTSVGVVGEDPFGTGDLATSLPAQFSFTIPTTISSGTYMFTADGTTSSGQPVESSRLLVDVEHSDAALGLAGSASGLTFRAPGEQASLSFFATFSGNVTTDVTASSLITYTSSNTGVASVDGSSGRVVVTAVAPGTCTITATYGQGTTSIPLSIPVNFFPALTASPASLSFGAQAVGTSSGANTTTLLNSGSSTVTILGLTITGDFSETDTCVGAGSLATGATCSINVVFHPGVVGTRTGSVTVTDSSNPSSLIVPLTGTGISNFSVSATPNTQTVTAGGSTSYTVSVAPLGGFSGIVSLSVAGLPTNTTASFTPTSINGGSGSSTLKVTTSSKTPVGTSNLTVTGTSGNLAHTAAVTLVVNAKH